MAGEVGYRTFQLNQQDDWNRSLMGNPLSGTPGASEWMKQNGYELQPDGNYRKATNVGGLWQVSVMTPGEAANKYKGQQYLQQASALPTATPDYLSQIRQYLNSQSSSADAAQQSLQNYGSSAESARGAYSNPYEDRLVQLMNNPDSIADTNAYKFRFNQGQQALERSAASRGMLNSGNTLAALADYGQGAASQEYGNEFNRLSSAVGQRNQYNVGRMGVANQELGLRQQWANDLSNQYNTNSGTALKALTSADEMYNERKKLALGAAQFGGVLKSGPSNSQSTW